MDNTRTRVLETTGLTKRYGARAAVDSVSCHIEQGEIYGFLGPNGAGKTTTMRMIMGLVAPTSGSLRLFDSDDLREARTHRVGALIETPAFYPYLSGWDNLWVVARHAGTTRHRVADVLEHVALADRSRDKVQTYSLGMRQRLGIAAALVKQPELLILDEPTGGLDPQGIADMRDLLRTLRDSGTTVMLSSHQLGDVQELCDRVGVIIRGSLVREETVSSMRGGAGLRVRATPLAEAKRMLEKLVGAESVTLDGDAFLLSVAPERSSTITRELVNAGIEVHGVDVNERSLEEAFLALEHEQNHKIRN